MSRRGLVLLPLLLCALAFAATRRSPETMRLWLINGAYWIVALFALCALRGAALWARERGERLASFRRDNAAGLLAAGALSALVFVAVPPRLRVLPDETVLIGVSRSMTFDKKVEVVAEAQRYFDTQFPENGPFEVQPRPHLFPFLLSVVHTATGYRVANAFALNFLVLWALLALVFAWTRELLLETGEAAFAKAGGFAAMLAVIAQPVVALSASSGGFDLLSAFCILLSLRALQSYLESSTPEGFEALWLSLLAAASVRYEGGVYLAVVGGALLLLGRLRRDHAESSVAFALTPVFLLPTLWQRCLSGIVDAPAGQIVASPSYALANTAAFLKAALRWDLSLPYASIINLAGLAGAAWFVASALRARNRPVLVAASALLAHWAVVSAFYFSVPDSPSASRYYGVFAIVLSVCAVLLAARLGAVRRRPTALVAAAAAMLLLYLPTAIEDRAGRSLALPREHEAVLDFLKDKKDFLLIADKPNLYTPYGFGALGFRTATSRASDLRARMTTFLIHDIFVIQEIDLQTGQPLGWETLPPELPLETLYELRTRVLATMRISRVRRG